LTISEYNRILRFFYEAAGSFIGIRNLIIIIMMLGLLGLRTGTIISPNIQDVDVFTGLLRVAEKGKRKRFVVMPKILCKALKQYLDQSEQYRGPLFLLQSVANASLSEACRIYSVAPPIHSASINTSMPICFGTRLAPI